LTILSRVLGGGIDAILKELDKLHAIGFVKDHLSGLRDVSGSPLIAIPSFL